MATERNEANAKIAHEARHKAALAGVSSVITFAVEALKSAVLINGGTAGALLAFVGQKGVQAQPGIGEAFYWFAAGLLCGAVASAFAYFAQFCYSIADRSYVATWDHPYVVNRPSFRWWTTAAITFHLVGILAVAASFAAAIRGFLVAARALPF